MNYINMRRGMSRFLRAGVGFLFMLFSSCSEDFSLPQSDDAERAVINVGGIEMDDLQTTTRAIKQNAETVDWLIDPLEHGLDITYGNIVVSGTTETRMNENVAILKLTDKTTNPATYTFKYRNDRSATVGVGNDAIWYNNGRHYFQGVHVPNRVRYTSNLDEVETKTPNLSSDQHDDTKESTGENEQGLGNYTLLAHYLGMPANYKLTATISRIKLPFRHRLARVVAFVLIDPILNTQLKGYTATVKDGEGNITAQDDPNTTSFRFNNVNVLKGVKDVLGDNDYHTLTPTWGKARKVIPHFEGERGSYSYKTNTELHPDFILYTKNDGNSGVKDVYPTSSDWTSIHNATPDASGNKKGYTPVNYGKVPVYDIIVRPTYTSQDSVMYDEENYATKKAELANAKNSIDFEIALENGLNYEKHFEFDLNADYQTVVYLRISREHVDYNDAGSELWIESSNNDDWYGVDNDNGNILSKAGTSWQRAYRTKKLPDTDKVTDGDLYDNGENVGQYLNSTDKWTELLLQAHEGGEHHGDYFVLDHDITIDVQQIPADFVFTGHLDAQDHVITLTGTNADTYEVTTDYDLAQTQTLYINVDETYVPFEIPTLYTCEEVAQAKPRNKVESIEAGEGMMIEVSPKPTLTQIMNNDVKYYAKGGDGKFSEWNPRSFTFYTYRISAGSLFCGLDGTYITAQEKAEAAGINIYRNPAVIWEANVHKETNKSTYWVPTLGYRAEVLNAVVRGGTLFPADASVTGNVQNCFVITADENRIAITNTPNIPQYK